MYALLHHPEYRERYEDDLKKMLPHIPRAVGFHTYASVGRELADLHVNYERVEPYPSVQEETSLHAPADPWERYRIGERKMRFPKLGRRDKDFTRLEYNDYVTLTGIPAGSSPVEWCNRFVSFGLCYALSWSGVSSCWVGWGVSRDLVRMSRLR